MFSLLLLFVIVWGLIHYSNKSRKTESERDYLVSQAISNSNRQWIRFIASYRTIARSKIENKFLDRLLKDVVDQGLASSQEVSDLEKEYNLESRSKSKKSSDDIEMEPGDDATSRVSSSSTAPNRELTSDERFEIKNIRLDNISLLLYFGAFLFVASVGLFVALSTVSGIIRTIAVLFLLLSIYYAGLWLYRSKEALKPAGLAFVGIGIAIAPLVGVAAYSFIEGSTFAAAWFITSVLCLALYGHALVAIRKPLLNYIFIFTLLSLFESSVSIMDAPVYYFGWMMAFVGIGLQIITQMRDVWSDFKESASVGAKLYIPLAVITSLLVVSTDGFGQLGITLLIGSLFYGVEFWRSEKLPDRTNFAIASHVSAMLGVSSVIYGLFGSAIVTGSVLAFISAVHIFALLQHRASKSPLFYSFASIMLASTIFASILVYSDGILFSSTLLLIVVQSLLTWRIQERFDAYLLGGLSWIALPFAFGLFALDSPLSTGELVWLSITSLAIFASFYVYTIQKKLNFVLKELDNYRSILLLSSIVLTMLTMTLSPGKALLGLLLISLIVSIASLFDKANIWQFTSGMIISLSVLVCWEDFLLLPAIVIALVYNILLALQFRSEFNRWASTVLWLILPIGLGGATTDSSWPAAYYAWSYIAVMAGLILSRGLARGVAFFSTDTPMSAYNKSASMSYVFGYIMAAVISVFISATTDDSRLVTTLVLILLLCTTLLLALYIEKSNKILSAIPILLQAIVLSAIRPSQIEQGVLLFTIVSIVVAILCYSLYKYALNYKGLRRFRTNMFAKSSIMASAIVPFSALFFTSTPTVIFMPLGLCITGLLLLDYQFNSHGSQNNKELSIAVAVLGLLWTLGYFEVAETQVYIHVLVGMVAGFAYWRHALGDKAQENNYIYIALSLATIPLALQALSGVAGGLYGWWLLIEQVFIMLIGTAIRKKFVIMWGLYFAVGSVLYQLRDLGYAALAVLAVLIIGIAIYQLQKYNK